MLQQAQQPRQLLALPLTCPQRQPAASSRRAQHHSPPLHVWQLVLWAAWEAGCRPWRCVAASSSIQHLAAPQIKQAPFRTLPRSQLAGRLSSKQRLRRRPSRRLCRQGSTSQMQVLQPGLALPPRGQCGSSLGNLWLPQRQWDRHVQQETAVRMKQLGMSCERSSTARPQAARGSSLGRLAARPAGCWRRSGSAC